MGQLDSQLGACVCEPGLNRKNRYWFRIYAQPKVSHLISSLCTHKITVRSPHTMCCSFSALSCQGSKELRTMNLCAECMSAQYLLHTVQIDNRFNVKPNELKKRIMVKFYQFAPPVHIYPASFQCPGKSQIVSINAQRRIEQHN